MRISKRDGPDHGSRSTVKGSDCGNGIRISLPVRWCNTAPSKRSERLICAGSPPRGSATNVIAALVIILPAALSTVGPPCSAYGFAVGYRPRTLQLLEAGCFLMPSAIRHGRRDDVLGIPSAVDFRCFPCRPDARANGACKVWSAHATSPLSLATFQHRQRRADSSASPEFRLHHG